MTAPTDDRLYLRQLRGGRDFATGVPFASEMANFVYVIGDRATREAILVDPAYDPAGLVDLVAELGFSLVGAFITHYHADHAGGDLGGSSISGIAELLEVADIPVHAQRSELGWISRQTGVPEHSLAALDPGDRLMVGELSFTAIHTPGHTPGSQCLYGSGSLVTGDTLFLNGCGRTDLPGGDPDALYDSLVHRLAPLEASTVVYAGHDYDVVTKATMAELRTTNAVLAPIDQATWRARFS